MQKILTDDNTPDEPCCKNCRFYKTIGEKDKIYICAHDPPRVTHVLRPAQTVAGMDLVWASFTGWPIVDDSKWCGKHDRVKH